MWDWITLVQCNFKTLSGMQLTGNNDIVRGCPHGETCQISHRKNSINNNSDYISWHINGFNTVNKTSPKWSVAYNTPISTPIDRSGLFAQSGNLTFSKLHKKLLPWGVDGQALFPRSKVNSHPDSTPTNLFFLCHSLSPSASEEKENLVSFDCYFLRSFFVRPTSVFGRSCLIFSDK